MHVHSAWLVALLALSPVLVACDPDDSDDAAASTSATSAMGSETEGQGPTSEGTSGLPSSTGVEPDPTSETATETTSSDSGGLGDVLRPCLDEAPSLPLPEAVRTKASSNQYAAAVVDAEARAQFLFGEIEALPFPPSDAVAVVPDDEILVGEDSVAYVWGVAPEAYLYVTSSPSVYRVRQKFDEDSLTPPEIVYVDQDENFRACTKFNVTHYAGDDSGDAQKGDALFSFSYRNPAGDPRLQFQENGWMEPETPEFTVRTFPDGSGDYLEVRSGGELAINWTPEGEGTFTLTENGQQVDTGTW